VLDTTRLGALWERVRRPVTMFAIGVGLAAPASAFMTRERSGDAAAAGTRLAAGSSMTAGFATAERANAQMTLGLSRLYDVPVGLAALIHRAASTEGIAPRLAFGLVRTESEFKQTAVSPVGAIGLTQVMPGTARTLKPGTTRQDLFDGTTNLHLGFGYLRELIDRYDGNVRLALTAYNRGPGTVDRLVKRGRNPENGYATKVLADPATQRSAAAQARTAPDDTRVATSSPRHAVRDHPRSHHRQRATRHSVRKHAVKHPAKKRRMRHR
jgi:soluble lytic murein transglycosylase-like protein